MHKAWDLYQSQHPQNDRILTTRSSSINSNNTTFTLPAISSTPQLAITGPSTTFIHLHIVNTAIHYMQVYILKLVCKCK